jgi:protein-S-isoprenylcysteine O-methyltransferase Ste14
MPILLTALHGGGRGVLSVLSVRGTVAGAASVAADWRLSVFGLVWVVFLLPMLIYLLTHPAILRRRARGGPLAEPEPSQRLIVALLVPCVLALFAVSVLDTERGWSQAPVAVVLLGDLLVAAGLVLLNLVFRANHYAAATVQVEAGQTVSARGPYALIRHPMYSAGLLLFIGAPLALGSWWGLVLFPALLALIILRLLDEERYLSAHLPGYTEYCARVTHRLIPFIW